MIAEKLPIWELHIQPTYAVCIPQRSGSSGTKSSARLENERNLLLNDHLGKISKKAARRLSNSVNWLVASARSKWIYDKTSGKRFSFKVNFVTLTLPANSQEISDHHFKSILLHNFINTCKAKFGMNNYVWKVEAQENGNIHAHFTTDTFIHWKDLRRVWNRILLKNGLIDTYQQKHSLLTFEEYCNLYNSNEKRSPDSMRKSYDYGSSTNWTDPNTTDVHAVWSVKDLAAYLCKYMSKSEEDRRNISGRLWGCSQSLSHKNKLVLELHGSHDQDLIEPFFHGSIKYTPIEGIDKLSGKPFRIGEMFFFKMNAWGSIIKGRTLDSYNEHRFNIRHSINAEPKKSIHSHEIEQPIHMTVVTPSAFFDSSSNQSNSLNYQYVNTKKSAFRSRAEKTNFYQNKRFREAINSFQKRFFHGADSGRNYFGPSVRNRSMAQAIHRNAGGFRFASRSILQRCFYTCY